MRKKSVFVLMLFTCLALFMFVGGSPTKIYAQTNYNAIVDGKFTGTDGAKVNGTPTYKTVTSALSNAPKDSKTQYIIFIKSGLYHEKLTINIPNITLIGESKDETKLSYDAANSIKKPDGTLYGTYGSSSVTVLAPNFTAENLTFENAFDYPKNMAKASTDPTKIASPQAVALIIDKGATHAYIKDCKLTGYQDTLYANSGSEYFTNCYISGSIDFIFGSGQAFFNKCDVVSRDLFKPLGNGYITAASTSIGSKYGFVFSKCNFKKETTEMADNSVALGRPWHPSADPLAVGSVIYMNCFLDSHIKDTGWDEMSSTNASGAVLWFTPVNSRFYEYNSEGPGAIKNSSRPLLSDADAKNCTETNVLGGWDPQ